MNAGSIVVLVIYLAAFSDAFWYPESDHPHREKRFAHQESSQEQQRGILDCKQPGAACRGFPPCCTGHVCYWESGFSPSRPGRCVTCVANGQMCQRDGQCCQSLICQKATSFTVNGRCGEKLPLGSECHDNDQCQSEYCEIGWYEDIIMGHGGTCANR